MRPPSVAEAKIEIEDALGQAEMVAGRDAKTRMAEKRTIGAG